jgi:hypothetical protein
MEWEQRTSICDNTSNCERSPMAWLEKIGGSSQILEML